MSYTEPLQDNDKMPFGMHKGKAMIEVPAQYLLYIYNNGMCSDSRVRTYIESNLDALKKEAGTRK